LHVEGIPLDAIADEVGTPVYVYAAGHMRSRLWALHHAFTGMPALFCYAVKANSNLAIIRALAAEGAGADTVSGGEILRALAAGVPPGRIVFAGVAKSDEEIRLALRHGIFQINVESIPELRRIAELAREQGVTAPVAFRVNPDVAAGTHEKISTGRKGDKFGIPLEAVAEAYGLARRLAGIMPVGLHIHIGSQITDTAPFAAAYRKAVDLFKGLRADGYPLRTLDFGGGFGVRYQDERPIEPEAIAAVVRDLVRDLDCQLIFEPGRFLVAEAGALVAGVIYVKEAGERRFAVLDAGMNVLVRPAMYGARHAILPVQEAADDRHLLPTDVVGPICESSDVFGRDYLLPPLRRGERVAILGAGAYGSVMASDYNSRPSPAEVLVDGDRWAVIRPRRLPEAQYADDRIPDWIGASLP
jgi:diaminopimelate decarboxylase